MPTSRPPYSTGQLTTDQRSSNMVRSQARCASKPSAVSREGRGSAGTCAASHARASARKASCSELKVRSMTQGIFHSTCVGANAADDQAPGAGGLCWTRVRTKKSTTAATTCDSEGTSPTVSNACPPSCTVNNSWGTPASPRNQASSWDCSG